MVDSRVAFYCRIWKKGEILVGKACGDEPLRDNFPFLYALATSKEA